MIWFKETKRGRTCIGQNAASTSSHTHFSVEKVKIWCQSSNFTVLKHVSSLNGSYFNRSFGFYIAYDSLFVLEHTRQNRLSVTRNILVLDCIKTKSRISFSKLTLVAIPMALFFFALLLVLQSNGRRLACFNMALQSLTHSPFTTVWC